ncbi:MAG: biotin--[acetyl-CoA-carboxylase] ligase [Candidatus Dadabacteria bacterium]|nr:biotin--[acetyl-CoA-carboxylase] ligase [Candidatus Dadabacteria bacterium]
MDLENLKSNISTNIIANDLFLFPEVSSTNEVIDKLFNDKYIGDGTVVISDHQTKGRGRYDRKWISPSGLNLYMSLLFKPDIEPSKFPIFTFLSSCALKDTFSLYNLSSSIKWPNDVLIGGKKISGVLTELKYSDKYEVNYLIVGIGVNINLTRQHIIKEMSDISEKVTSMSIELNNDVNRELFTAELINKLDEYYSKFLNYGSSVILDDWLTKWDSIGKSIKVNVDGKLYEGIVKDVDENGFLYLITEGYKTVKVISGDMIF